MELIQRIISILCRGSRREEIKRSPSARREDLEVPSANQGPISWPDQQLEPEVQPPVVDIKPPVTDGELLEDERWLALVEECVELYDELDRHRAGFDPAAQALVDHVCLRLEEILERSGVETISTDSTFDRTRHQPDGKASVAPGATIAEILSPGFFIGRRVLRRARVRVDDASLSKTGERV